MNVRRIAHRVAMRMLEAGMFVMMAATGAAIFGVAATAFGLPVVPLGILGAVLGGVFVVALIVDSGPLP